MGAQDKAVDLGVSLEPQEPGYLNLCIRTGNLLITSGHVSDAKGVLGNDLSVDQGYEAAKDCMMKILRSVHATHGTLDGLRVIKLLGCVYSDGEFTDQRLVINGASDLLVKVFGDKGKHARSAVGMNSLPMNISVEIEMIVEVED